jgi:hypothetical protein
MVNPRSIAGNVVWTCTWARSIAWKVSFSISSIEEVVDTGGQALIFITFLITTIHY